MKSKIDPSVRAKLEELGADVVRSKLIAIMRSFAQQDEPKQPLGDSLSTARREMQEWLKEKAADDRWWMKTAAIAAVTAAVISFLAAIISFLAWRFPMK